MATARKTAQTVPPATGEAALAKIEGPFAYLQRHEADFARLLPAHLPAASFLEFTAAIMSRTADPQLITNANANPGSFIAALMDAARLGHQPMTPAYYLVPFGKPETDNAEVVGIEGYRGIIERMFRSGAVVSVHAEVVRQVDGFKPNHPHPPIHEFDPFADEEERGALRGAYAYALIDSPSGRAYPSQVVIMGRAAVMKRKAESRGSDSKYSPWQKWEEDMWRKCPLRKLERYVPTSAEFLSSRLRSDAAAGVFAQQVETTGAIALPRAPEPTE